MLTRLEKNELEDKIKGLHSGDKKQLEVIFSQSKRLVVEAPAGYGKTKTMISKLAYMLATSQIKNQKKVLALTFSVNAAYKIKKDVAEQLPNLLQTKTSRFVKPQEKLFISNYHGFCRHILKLYGYLLHGNLTDIDTLKTVDDSNSRELIEVTGLAYDNLKIFDEYSKAVKSVNREYINNNCNLYVEEVKQKLLDKKYISFNAIIIFVLELFEKYPSILEFYQNYFSAIIVDEFQDTNLLSWTLLKRIISEDSRVFFIGDSLQRIYGFIGAIPDLMLEARQLYNMETISLNKNYRFKDNPQMLQLDKNIRLNAEDPKNPVIVNDAEIFFYNPNNQEEEAKEILNKIIALESVNSDKFYKVAILVKKNKGYNIDKIFNCLSNNNIPYYYALFSDEDYDYLRFHRECYFRFNEHIKNERFISRKSLDKFYKVISEYFLNINNLIITSLLDLLKVFLERVITEYNFLSLDEKIVFIRETFENKALRQNMEYIDKNVIVCTIHGAKGLEWDYVIMPDMEQYSNPNWYGLCGECTYKKKCDIKISDSNERKFLEELSVFYVGVTRARKQVFFSASKTQINSKGVENSVNISCLLKLPGIKFKLDN